MGATSALSQDHTHLRKRLTLLESALRVVPDARFILREMCFSLLRELQDHMDREAAVLQSHGHLVTLQHFPPSARDHSAECALTRSIIALLLEGVSAADPSVIRSITQTIEQLRIHMEEQERMLFHLLDRLEGFDLEGSLTAISGAMSVNEVLNRYPQTEQVFEQFHINRMRDGYESVDEWAWRHGMEVSPLIERLRAAATPPPTAPSAQTSA